MAHRIFSALALGAGYFVFASISVVFTRFEGGTAFIWGASAVLLGVLVASEPRFWGERAFACGLASLLATWLFSMGFTPGVFLAFINVGEVIVAALILRRAKFVFGEMASLQEIGWIIGAAGIAGPLASSIPGALVITAYSSSGFFQNWSAWITGHSLGIFIFGPLAILIAKGKLAELFKLASNHERTTAICLVILLAAVCATVFSQSKLPLLFVPLPFLVFNTFQVGRFGSVASLVVLFIAASYYSLQGVGPIGSLSLPASDKALILQLYLASASLTVLPIAADLTRRRSRFVEMRNEAVFYKLALECSSDLILECNPNGRIRFISESSDRILGTPPHHLVDRNVSDLIHRDDFIAVRKSHRELFTGQRNTVSSQFRIRQKGGDWGWFESHARRGFGGSRRWGGIIAVVRDINDRKTAEEWLFEAATTDPLTGLANRRAFETALKRCFRGHPADSTKALALFDIDHFKTINDRYGHGFGDEVLRSFARLLEEEIREGDLACRYGGEEFAVLLEGDLDSARTVCERVRQRFSELTLPANGLLNVNTSVSAGVVTLPPKGEVQTSLRDCDKALYRAKRTGRNRVVT